MKKNYFKIQIYMQIIIIYSNNLCMNVIEIFENISILLPIYTLKYLLGIGYKHGKKGIMLQIQQPVIT